MIGLMLSAASSGGLASMGGADPAYVIAFLAAGLLFLGIGCFFLCTESEDPDYAGRYS